MSRTIRVPDNIYQAIEAVGGKSVSKTATSLLDHVLFGKNPPSTVENVPTQLPGQTNAFADLPRLKDEIYADIDRESKELKEQLALNQDPDSRYKMEQEGKERIGALYNELATTWL